MKTGVLDDAADALFAGPGEARALARAVNWSATPLGPVGDWSHVLRSSARTCMASPTPLCIWAGSRFTLIHNDAYIPFLGVKSSWAMGRAAQEVWAEIWEQLEPDFRRVFETGDAITCQDTRYVIRRHGRDEEGFFTFTISPIEDDSGVVVALLNVSQETTSTLRTIRGSEEKFRALFDAIDEGFCIIDVLFDETGRANDYRFVEVNPAFEEHTGLANARGKRVRELVPQQDEHWFQTYGKVATTGEAIRFETRGEALNRDFDVYAFRVGAPEQRRIAVLFNDVSARRRAEEALRASEERLRADVSALIRMQSLSGQVVEGPSIEPLLQETVDVAVAMMAADMGNMQLVEGDTLRIVAHSGYDAPFLDYFAAAEKVASTCGEATRRGERVIVPDVEASPIFAGTTSLQVLREAGVRAVQSTPLRTRSGRLLGILTTQWREPHAPDDHDLSRLDLLARQAADLIDVKQSQDALREVNRQLRESDRRKTEFLAMLSHELRNPLAPIRNSIYLLERAPPASEQAARAREAVRRQTEHLTRLVDDLLDVTRISYGKIQMERGRVDLRDIVRKTTDDLHSMFTQGGIDLRVDYVTVGPMWIEADPTRMAQLLTNLLNNSMKFTPSDGTVRVSVAARDGHAELCVRDDGVGIDPKHIEQMFEPFAQADQSLARSKGGLGLGLALVKSIAELHGGTVAAHSDGPGRGAEFLIRIPLADAAAASEKPRGVDAATIPQTIVVIEDNVDGAQSLADVLEMHGHRVRVARDGRSGIALAREVRPDIILCDIGLPDVDGYEVARTLRSDGPLRSTRLVALSGYAQPEDLRRVRDAGFDAHLAKPVELDELLSLVMNDS